MNPQNREKLFRLIRASLWDEPNDWVDQETFDEMQKQSLTLLPAGILHRLNMAEELRTNWKTVAYQLLAFCTNCRHAEKSLPITVPYVILKGTSAARYYPNPNYRILGDIDIMTRHKDYPTACEMLLNAGYLEETVKDTNGNIRHRSFKYNDVIVEVHSYFAMLNDVERTKYLDELIIDNINPSHVLPDPINGLVILEHIGQHLEEGLGLRQVLDWMMFANSCLSDEQWPEFRAMAAQTGLEKLAITTTRMCEMFLGLPKRQWCSETDDNLCEVLMEYILNCGNFGAKREYLGFRSEKLLSYMRTPRATFALLQKYGLYNWKATKKYPVLRPFAWIYQAVKYIKIIVSRKATLKQLKSEIRTAKERNALFDALEVTQTSKGLVIYKEGEYVKE